MRAAVAGSRQADDSDTGRREESPRVSWAPAPLTVLSVGCDFGGAPVPGGSATQSWLLGSLFGFFSFPARALLLVISGMGDKWCI